MKNLPIAIVTILILGSFYLQQTALNELRADVSAQIEAQGKNLGVATVATSDTLDTLRIQFNNLVNDRVTTTTAQTWTQLNTFSSGVSASQVVTTGSVGAGSSTPVEKGSVQGNAYTSGTGFFGGTVTATSSAYVATSAGKLGIGSTTPLGTVGVGSANATSTISGGYFCAFFQDEAKRGLWVKLAISGNTVFSTSTTPCN